MRNFVLLKALLFLAFMTSSCADNGGQKHQESASKSYEGAEVDDKVMSEAVEILVQANVTSNKRVMVKGTTNLPNSTSFLVTLVNEHLGTRAQTRVNVLNGGFISDELGELAGVSDGHYTVEVFMPLPSMQPDVVQEKIGKKGEYLFGPLVEESEWGGKVVVKTIEFDVGDPESIVKIESQHQELVSDLKAKVQELLEHGKKMEEVRNTKDLEKISSCGSQMRENQAVADRLSEKAEGLSLSYIILQAAIIDARSCVSCSPTALESCASLEEAIMNDFKPISH